MNNSILYYPSFEPNQKWLRSVLLLVDQIQRIIPADAQHVDSPRMQKLIDVMPGAFQTISPVEGDKYFDDLNFDRLRKAFELIRKNSDRRPSKSFSFTIDKRGYITSMKWDVWLSNAKLSERVRELLFEYGLADDLQGLRPFGDTFPANKEASNLIISYIADRIAKRTGLNTITDVAIPYAVQSLDSLGASANTFSREGEGLLAAAVATIAIPDGVERMDVHAFQALRESFADVRAPFHEMIRSLARRSCLDRQESATAAEARIEQAIGDYKREMENYKKTAFARQIDKWTPISLQGLLGILAVFSPEAIQVIEAAGILGIEVMKDRIASKEKPIEHEDIFRMLCSLEKQIDQKQMVAGLI